MSKEWDNWLIDMFYMCFQSYNLSDVSSLSAFPAILVLVNVVLKTCQISKSVLIVEKERSQKLNVYVRLLWGSGLS